MTAFEGFTPNRHTRVKRHLVAILAFDGVVLGDLAAPSEVLALARTTAGLPAYELRICSERQKVLTQHVGLHVPWRLSSLMRADTIIVPGLDDLERPILDGVK